MHPSEVATAWYRDWFDGDYLKVYAHRDRGDAVDYVDLLMRATAAAPGARLLDVACGAGRHLPLLTARGLRVTGLDLSPTLLAEARRTTGGAVPLVRADMRALPFPAARFALVSSFFTSFGYFDDGDNRAVLAEQARALGAGGHLFLDLLNRDAAVRDLLPESRREASGLTVRERRRWDPDSRRIRKDIELDDGGAVRRVRESVRLYDADELAALLGAVGLAVVDRFGDGRGAPYDPAASPRLVVIARRA